LTIEHRKKLKVKEFAHYLTFFAFCQGKFRLRNRNLLLKESTVSAALQCNETSDDAFVLLFLIFLFLDLLATTCCEGRQQQQQGGVVGA
jgi:hypothetical protein